MFVRENIKRRMQNFISFFISLIILKPREQYLYFNVSIEIACNPLFINFCNPRKEGEKHKSFETVWNIRWRFESSGKRRNAEQAHNSRRKINQGEISPRKTFRHKCGGELSVESETDQEIVSREISTYDRKSRNFLLSSMRQPFVRLHT